MATLAKVPLEDTEPMSASTQASSSAMTKAQETRNAKAGDDHQSSDLSDPPSSVAPSAGGASANGDTSPQGSDVMAISDEEVESAQAAVKLQATPLPNSASSEEHETSVEQPTPMIGGPHDKPKYRKKPLRKLPPPPLDRMWAHHSFMTKSNRPCLEEMLEAAGKNPKEDRFTQMSTRLLREYCKKLQRNSVDGRTNEAGVITSDEEDEGEPAVTKLPVDRKRKSSDKQDGMSDCQPSKKKNKADGLAEAESQPITPVGSKEGFGESAKGDAQDGEEEGDDDQKAPEKGGGAGDGAGEGAGDGAGADEEEEGEDYDLDDDYLDSDDAPSVDEEGMNRASAALKAIKRAAIYDGLHYILNISDDIDFDCDESDDEEEAEVMSKFTWKTILYVDDRAKEPQPLISLRIQHLVREILDLRAKLTEDITDEEYQNRQQQRVITIPIFKRRCQSVATELAKMINGPDNHIQAKAMVNRILIGKAFKAGHIR